jgi:hypothetical protein
MRLLATEGAALIWTEQALREYVLPEMHPRVIVDWMSPTDGAQHAHGVGSPEALGSFVSSINKSACCRRNSANWD